MFNLSITACSFSLNNLYCKDRKKSFNLNENIEVKKDEDVVSVSVQKLFEDFFEAYADCDRDDENQKTFRCVTDITYFGRTDSFEYFYAIIHSGIYGSASNITNVYTREVTHQMKANEAPERPFYLFIVIPNGSETITVQKGMLIFQNIGQYGVKTITLNKMVSYFSEKYKIALKSSTISAELFIKTVMTKENIKKITMVKNHINTDVADRAIGRYGVETKSIEKLHFDDGFWKTIFNRIKHCAKGKANLFEFENKNYDNVKVEVKIGDRNRTINIHNLDNLSIIEGIPEEIRMADGLPEEKRLISHIKKVANEYLGEMALEIK